MKESTGELSMVVVTLLAIALIAGIVRFLVPLAQQFVEDKWGEITETDARGTAGSQRNNGAQQQEG